MAQVLEACWSFDCSILMNDQKRLMDGSQKLEDEKSFTRYRHRIFNNALMCLGGNDKDVLNNQKRTFSAPYQALIHGIVPLRDWQIPLRHLLVLVPTKNVLNPT